MVHHVQPRFPTHQDFPNPDRSLGSPAVLRRRLAPPPVRPRDVRRGCWHQAVRELAPDIGLPVPDGELLEALFDPTFVANTFLPEFEGAERAIMWAVCYRYIALGAMSGL